MAYTKHIWETGEVITAEKLNNLENGVASSGENDSLCVVFTIIADFDDNDNLYYYLQDESTLSALFGAATSGKIVVLYDYSAIKYYYIDRLIEETNELVFLSYSGSLITDSSNNHLIPMEEV